MKAPLIAALVLAGCGPKCPEPQYEGKASDEAYLTMVDGEARATADADKAPKLDFADGAVFTGKTTFRWTSTLTASADPVPSPRRALPKAPWHQGLLLSSAWAHLPPVTGSIFWLKIAVPGESCPVELLSTRGEWAPTDEIWAKLAKGTGARTVTAYSAYLTENRITEGPYKAPAAVKFTVSP